MKDKSKILSGRREFLSTLGLLPGAFLKNKIDTKHIAVPEEGTGVVAVLLGSAQDGGVPHAGCLNEPCISARSDFRLRRRSPCLAILDYNSRQSFIFDAGPDFDEQMAMLPPSWKKGRNLFDALFITHAHVGHYTGLQFLGRAIMNTDNIPVYCSQKMEAFIRKNGPWSLSVEIQNILPTIIQPDVSLKINERISVTPLSVPHRAEFTDTFAYRIASPEKSILFLPDIDRWEEMSPSIESVLETVDIALVDGTFYSPDELPGRDMSVIPHPRITDSMNRFQYLAVKKETDIVFIHLNHSNPACLADSKESLFIKERGFQIGYDGMSFKLCT